MDTSHSELAHNQWLQVIMAKNGFSLKKSEPPSEGWRDGRSVLRGTVSEDGNQHHGYSR